MNANFQFTRYLYEKEEVEIALLISILKRTDDALFWAFELSRSGYNIIPLLWKIYYDFYASINPGFEKYLSIKLKEKYLDDNTICLVIKNLMIRRHNIDVFIVRSIVKQFDIEVDEKPDLPRLLGSRDFLALGAVVLEYIKEDQLVYSYRISLEYFASIGIDINVVKMVDEFKKKGTHQRIAFLSAIIHHSSAAKQIKMGRNLYVRLEPDQVETLTMKYGSDLQTIVVPYKILPTVRIYDIDEDNHLSLFKLKRDTANIVEAYRDNWLFHASFSPLWKARLDQHNGSTRKAEVVFDDEENEERFYELFDLEPDEQKLDVQQKSIREIKVERSWLSFYKEHKNEGVVDVDDDTILEIHKITY